MATYGNVGEFHDGAEEWTAYTEHLEHYFTVNDIDSVEKKRAILRSICGPTTYSLIRSLVSPKKATEYTFAELVEKVAKHFNPRPSATVQRYKFNSRCRQSGESVADYVAALRALSENCEFGDTLNDMLRDRLVWGIDDSRIQHRLLAEASLTLLRPSRLHKLQSLPLVTSRTCRQVGEALL